MSGRKEKKYTEEQFSKLKITQKDWQNFWQKRIEHSLPKEYRPEQRKVEPFKAKYKTVFQIVIETRAINAEQAESEALKQLIKFVGEKETSQIISRNYPVTTEMER